MLIPNCASPEATRWRSVELAEARGRLGGGCGALKRMNPNRLRAAGVRRRVIEGEGLGGFARRVTVNDSAEGLFRPRRFFCTQIAEPPENSKAVGDTQPTALPSSPRPYRAPDFLTRHRQGSRTGWRCDRVRPHLPFRGGGTAPVRPRKNSA